MKFADVVSSHCYIQAFRFQKFPTVICLWHTLIVQKSSEESSEFHVRDMRKCDFMLSTKCLWPNGTLVSILFRERS